MPGGGNNRSHPGATGNRRSCRRLACCAPPRGPREQPTGEGPGGRNQPLILKPTQELALGRKAYREILKEYEGRILPDTSEAVKRVRRITARLAKVAEIDLVQRE